MFEVEYSVRAEALPFSLIFELFLSDSTRIDKLSLSQVVLFKSMFTGTPNRVRRGESSSGRAPFISQNSSVTEAPSDEIEQEQEVDEDAEPARVTT